MINPEQIAEVLADYSAHYNLDQMDVLKIVEQSVAETMSMRYRRYSEVYIDTQTYRMDIFLYAGSWDNLRQYPLPLSKVRGWNQIHRHLEHNVKSFVSFSDTRRLRPHVGELCKGAIINIQENGDVYVEIVLHEQIIAKWPLINQPKRERSEGYLYGENKIFRIKNVVSGYEQGVPRTYVMLERNSCAFVTALLHHWSDFSADVRCKCVKRNTGNYAEIWTNTFLDKAVLKRVQQETGEFLTVCVGDSKEELLQRRKELARKGKKGKKSQSQSQAVDLYDEFMNA